MKKYISIICLSIIFLLNTNISFADLSQSQQENYKKQIEVIYNNFNKSIA